VAIEMPNPLVEGESTLTSQVEGVQIRTPLTNNTKGPNRSTNNNTQIFQQVSLPKGLNLAKKKIWTRSGQLAFMKQTSFS
jgi:hypothetical protein